MRSPPGWGTPGYVYLLSRLRNRQITMEEATELFSLQQQLLATLAASRSTAPPAPAPGAPAPGPTASPAVGLPVSDEGLLLGLLAMGAGAGVLAAVMKRAQEGPRKPSQ